MTGFIIRDDEQKTLFYALIQYLSPKAQKFEQHVNKDKIREIVLRIAERKGYEEKLTKEEWLEIGITKFTTIQEIQEIYQKKEESMYRTAKHVNNTIQKKEGINDKKVSFN
jgi:glutaredoxin 2